MVRFNATVKLVATGSVTFLMFRFKTTFRLTENGQNTAEDTKWRQNVTHAGVDEAIANRHAAYCGTKDNA